MTEMLTKKLDGVILGIKIKTKGLTDATPFLGRLRSLNPSLAEDYEKKLLVAWLGKK